MTMSETITEEKSSINKSSYTSQCPCLNESFNENMEFNYKLGCLLQSHSPYKPFGTGLTQWMKIKPLPSLILNFGITQF